MTQTEFDAILATINDPAWREQVYQVWQEWTPEKRTATRAERLYVDVADTILGFSAETQGAARPVSELIAGNIPRDHMTEEEERAFVNHWFNEYERTGFAATFDSPYGDLKKYKGQKFEVLGRFGEDTHDLEVLPAWRIRLECGVELQANPEEICKLEREQSKAPQKASNTIRFDPKDWDSIRETFEKINEVGCMQFGTTEQGEDIFFDVTKDGALHTTVLQNNGWERHNYYYIADCSVDELYKKGDREVEEPARAIEAQEKVVAGEQVVVRAHKATMDTRYGTDHAVVYDDPASPKYASAEEVEKALMDALGYEPSDDPDSEYPGYWTGDDDVGAYFDYTGFEDLTLPASLVSGIRKDLEEKLLLSETNAQHFKEERDALLEKLQALKASKDLEEKQGHQTRIVETPGGQIVAYPKHEVDSPEDYPGIYVDLILPDGTKHMLACVEYDSCAKDFLGCLYGNAMDDSPTDTRHYENIKELQAQCRPTLAAQIHSAEGHLDNNTNPSPSKDKSR